MRLLPILVSSLLLLIIASSLGTQLASQTFDQKSAVMKEALRVTLMSTGSYTNLWTQDNIAILLLTPSLDGVDLPSRIGGVEIIPLDQGEIDARLSSGERFLYLVVEGFEVNSDEAKVSAYFTGVFDSGMGIRVYLDKVDGIWFGEFAMTWIA